MNIQVVLTKTDCVSKNELFKAIQSVFIELNKRNRQAGVPFVHIVSAKSGEGIEDLKREIGGIVYQEFAPMEAVSAEVSAMRKAEEELIMNKGKS